MLALLVAALAAVVISPTHQDTNSTVRLSNQLDAARIASPLSELRAAKDLAALDAPSIDLLMQEGFEDFDWEFSGWPASRDARITSDEGGSFLRIDGLRSQPSIGWTLPVRLDAFYRFERSVRVDGAPFCDVYVVESRREFDESPVDPDDYFLAGRGDALKIHGLSVRETGDREWQRGSTTFYPTPRTQSLVVVVRPRVGTDVDSTVHAMDFDDITLEEVIPSHSERMQLLKGAHVARSASAELGMRKAGFLLPLPSPDRVRTGEPAESNYTWREALYAPPGTTIAIDVTIPPGAQLRFATGLARETPPKAAARFRVEFLASGASEPALLHEMVRSAVTSDWHWDEVDIDLAAYAGKSGALVLRTTAEKGDAHPLWADPRIEPSARSTDPLVILIAVDTLRADHLSSYGYERPTTPALDRLAQDGVRFDQARSNCNWTCPSFASIFTGLVPSRHGVSSYGPATPLPEELTTLAEEFQTRGYATHSIAYKVPLFDGNYEQGFDQFYNVPRDVIRGEENLARALEWLEGHRGGPAFLFLHFNDPHQPFVQPEPFDRAYGPTPDELGVHLPIGVPSEQQEELVQLFGDLYDGAVSYVDACIGRFLDALRERGLYDGATIAFVADHGEALWEHGRFGHGGDDLFDETVRVPLLVKPSTAAPFDDIERGRVVMANVGGFDVMPTLLDLSGIRPPDGLDARSLVPLLRGTATTLDRVVATETSQRGLAIVDGPYKFVLEPGGKTEALYDLQKDPAERRNLATANPSVMVRMRNLAIAYILEHRPGDYLLAHAGAEPAEIRVGTSNIRLLAGPYNRLVSMNEQDGATIALPAHTWSLFEIEDTRGTAIPVAGLEARSASTNFEPWLPGTLAELADANEVGFWRVTGPERRTGNVVEASAANDEAVDAELLDALRRLGYAE